MFYNKKARKIIKTVWTIVAALIIISMVLLYSPFWK